MTAQLADVLAWVLIHSLWQGICIAAATCLLMRIIPARSANFRYVTCVAGMLTIVLGMLVTGAILTLEPQGSTVASAAVNLEQRLNSPVPPGAPVVALPTAHRVNANGVKQSENRVNQPLSPVAPHWSLRWASWMIAAWLVGVAVMLLRTAAAIIQVRSWRKSIVVVDPQQLAPLAAILQRMCEQLGFRWVVTLVVSERVRVPAIVGVFAPCILVPAAMLTGVSIDHWQVILAHELAHIRRYDALVNLVQMLIESVLFFNPSAWWLSRQIRVEREACCDALAAKLCGESVVVARALVEFAAGLAKSGSNIAVTPALATFADPAAPGDLTDRVHRLVEPDMAAHPRVSWGGLLVVMASLVFTALALNWGTGVVVKTAARLISPQERVAELERLQNQATGDVFPPEPSDSAAATANGSQAVPKAPEKVVRQYAVTVVIRTFDGKPLAKEAYAMGVSRNGDFGTVSSLWHNYSQQSECRETFKYAPCELLIAARCRGYSDIVSPILDLRSGPLARTVELILARSRTVKVLVRDESGRPVPGARLKSSASIELGGTRGGFGPSELIADSGGVITMTGVGNLGYQMNVRAPGFEWQELIRDLSQVETMQVELKKGRPTLFNVIDAATGQPVSQARFVTLRVSNGPSTSDIYGDPRRQAVDAWSSFGETDAAGRLILDELNGQVQYAIGVLAEGYGLAVVQDVRAGQPPATVKMFPPFKLAGRIVGALDRLADTPSKSAAKPQRTFSYSYSFLKNNRNSGEQVTVDERGHFEIDNLSFGEEITLTLPDRDEKFVVTKSIPDLEFSVPSVSERAARDVLIHLTGTTAGAPARGTIRVDSTHPDPAVRLESKPAPALLENEVMLNFPIGTQLRIQADKLVGYQIDPLQVEVVAGPRRQFIDIPARPAGGILTTILHADGSRATKGKVHVWAVKLPPGHKDNSKLNPSMQDPAAEILSSLPLGGSYRILAYEWNQDRVTAVVSDEVTLDESQPVAELKLQFKDGMPVAFEVRRPDGRPAQGATVALNFYFGLPKTSNFGSCVSCVTNDQGVAVFKDVVDVAAIAPLKCNMYVTVAPSDYRGWLGTLDLRHPEVIQLQPGVTASGVLVDAVSGKPIPHAAVRIGARDYGQAQYTGHLETTTDSQGVFRFQGLERIEYRVYLNGAVAPGTVVIPVPGREPRFEYPAGQQGLTLRGGDQAVRLKVVLYPGSPLKVAD